MQAASTPVAFHTRSQQARKRKSPTQIQLEGELKDLNVSGAASAKSDLDEAREEEQSHSLQQNKIMGENNQADESKSSGSLSSRSKIGKVEATSADAEQATATGELPADGEDAGVVVLNVDELTALEDPGVACKRLIVAITSDDWQEQYEGMTTVRRLASCHTGHDDPCSTFLTENFEGIIQLLTLGVGSLRSAMSRNALFAIGELFEYLAAAKAKEEGDIKGAIEFLQQSNAGVMEALMDAVIIKSVNEKRFIAVAGEAVLGKMIQSVPSRTLLRPMLKHAESKSSKRCSVVARYGVRCLKDVLKGPEAKLLVANDAKKLVISFALLESSRSVEAKKPAAQALRLLHNALAAQEFKKALEEKMSPAQVAQVMAIVNKPSANSSKVVSKKPSVKEMMAQKRREMIKAAGVDEKAASAPLPSSSSSSSS